MTPLTEEGLWNNERRSQWLYARKIAGDMTGNCQLPVMWTSENAFELRKS